MAEKSVQQNILVAVFDIGTSTSGYAFSFLHDYITDPFNILTNRWCVDGGGRTSEMIKAPTTILFTPKMDFHSFGYEAEEKFAELADSGENRSWFYLKEFKMALHNKELHEKLLLQDIHGHFVPAIGVFTETIGYLRKHLLKAINNRGFQYRSDDILYVITVPAIWKDAAKQFMRTAARRAGIAEHQLKLAFEPEAAALYCQKLPLDQLHLSVESSQGIFSLERNFIVLDLGGGTADIAVLKLKSDGLHQIYKASGGAWGGTDVNKEFITFLQDIFGEEIWLTFYENHMDDYLDLIRSFEIKKRTLSLVSDQNDFKFHIPASLKKICKKKGNPIEDCLRVSKYRNIKYKTGKLYIDKSICINFFITVIRHITTHVKTILSQHPCAGVDLMVMVGGFSESPIVQETMKKEFSNIRVVIPFNAGVAVMKGGVLYGHNPREIVSRVCPYTYGIAVTNTFIPGKHPMHKTFLSDGKLKTDDCFEKMFTVNEVLMGQIVRSVAVHQTYYNENPQERREPKEIELFSTTYANPEFVTDPGCKSHGKIQVSPPDGRWPIVSEGKIEVEMGGTEMIVRYVDKYSNHVVSGSIDFLS